jgi:hypothetical protein
MAAHRGIRQNINIGNDDAANILDVLPEDRWIVSSDSTQSVQTFDMSEPRVARLHKSKFVF